MKRYKVRRLLTRAQYTYIYAKDTEEAVLLARQDQDDIAWNDGKISDEEIVDCFEVDANGREVVPKNEMN